MYEHRAHMFKPAFYAFAACQVEKKRKSAGAGGRIGEKAEGRREKTVSSRAPPARPGRVRNGKDENVLRELFF